MRATKDKENKERNNEANEKELESKILLEMKKRELNRKLKGASK